MKFVSDLNARRSNACARASQHVSHLQTVTIEFTQAQLDRLRAGAEFFGVTTEALCVAGCLNVMDTGDMSEVDSKETTVHLIGAYARRRATFYRPEYGTNHAVQLSPCFRAGL